MDRNALHGSVTDPMSRSMTFLNEVAGRFPEAISLAAGRPYLGFDATEDIGRYLAAYREHLQRQGLDRSQVREHLLQYGRTNGQIGGLITRMLATDEAIHVPPEAVVVTVGCQEALVIALRGLCAGPADAVLASSPCYAGITGAARLLGVPVQPVAEGDRGLDPRSVAAAARAARLAGRRPRAMYVVPNFSNPSGVSLSRQTRCELLQVAADEDLLLLEDDPYGLFGLDDSPRSTLKALDTEQRVIYLGSFAKSCFPGARVGFLVADQTVTDRSGRCTLLAEELATVKGMLTVNTSPISQAVIGGLLVANDGSLRAANRERIAFYRRNLRTLLAALDRHLAGGPVRWRSPDGGFFVVLEVPFHADEQLLEVSARDYGVLWTPMSFFYPEGGGAAAIRLSCSWLEPRQIEEGVRRLAELLADRAGAADTGGPG